MKSTSPEPQAVSDCVFDFWQTRWQALWWLSSTAPVITSAWLRKMFFSQYSFCRPAHSSLSFSLQKLSGLCSGDTNELDPAIVYNIRETSHLHKAVITPSQHSYVWWPQIWLSQYFFITSETCRRQAAKISLTPELLLLLLKPCLHKWKSCSIPSITVGTTVGLLFAMNNRKCCQEIRSIATSFMAIIVPLKCPEMQISYSCCILCHSNEFHLL